MALNITDSADIRLLDSKITADLCAGKILVDVTPSEWVGAGDAYVEGASVRIVNPLSVTVKDYLSSGYDIEAPMTDEYSYTLPLIAANYLYGDYIVSVRLTDSVGNDYEVVKTVNICPPNKNNKTKKTGCLSAKITAKCKKGIALIMLNQPPTYKGKNSESQVNDLELNFPTGSEEDNLQSTIDRFSVRLYQGVYKLSGSVCATYNYGKNVYFKIPYTVDCEKKLVCILDECCVQGKLEELKAKVDSDCTQEERDNTSSLIVSALFYLKLAQMAQDCGEDPSDHIIELEKLLGCSCSCNCDEGSPIFTGEPGSDYTFEGCGFEEEETGLTKKITIYNRTHELLAGSSNVHVSQPVIDEDNCKVTQEITVDNPDPFQLCEATEEDIEQANDLDPERYRVIALVTDLEEEETQAGCTGKGINAATGFAVTGTGRQSFFGKMKWFNTLTDANAAAVSGDTVLLYSDSDDKFYPKNGVNYQGIGQRTVPALEIGASTPYKGRISNITVSSLMSIGASTDNTTEIFATNFLSLGDFTIDGYAKWHGGVFMNHAKLNSITGNAYFGGYFTERHTVYKDSASGNNFKIRDTSDLVVTGFVRDLGALVVTSSVGVKINRADVVSTNYTAIFSNIISNNGFTKLTHSDGEALGTGHGIYFHCGGEIDVTQSLFSHCTGKSMDGDGIQVAKAYEGDVNYITNNRVCVSHNTGYSVNRYGIYSISASLQNCTGDGGIAGIRIAGSDDAYVNVAIINCVGKGGVGLSANRDIRIYGGVYESRSTAATGYPISLTVNTTRPVENYVIENVTTIAISDSATCYAIKGDASVNLRVGGCGFTNPNKTTGVVGIDPLITLRAVTIDAYGNRT